MLDKIYAFDFTILDWIDSTLVHPFLDFLFAFITFLGDAGWFWIALTALFLLFKKTRRIGVTMAISLIFSLLVTNLTLKPLINRPRPYALREVTLRVEPPHDASFPSGHSSASFAAAVALFIEDKKKGTPALILAALIAFSRLYFYLHFPTDVLGGALVGCLGAIVAKYLTPYAYKGFDSVKQKFTK